MCCLSIVFIIGSHVVEAWINEACFSKFIHSFAYIVLTQSLILLIVRAFVCSSTHNDEMCNFYMMYSVSAADKAVLQSRTLAGCFTEGDAELGSLGVNTG